MQRIGVLALQGDVSEHVTALERAMQEGGQGGRGEVVEIRKSGQMEQCQALVLPGGESTAIFRQLERSGLTEELKAAAISGKPILATCAGLVLVSKEIEGDGDTGQATRSDGYQDQPECLRAAEGVL